MPERPDSSPAVTFLDRATGELREEAIYGEAALRSLYETRSGLWLTHRILAARAVSRLSGLYWSSPVSRRRIAPFISRFGVPMAEFEDRPYRSFNEFFVRRFRSGARTFATDPRVFPAFAEGRFLVFAESRRDQAYPVKGEYLQPRDIIGDGPMARSFDGGGLFIARLCPVDYHRYHYPDRGRTIDAFDVPGPLHSVHPIALRARPAILSTNRRRVSILDTENFGRLVYIEVGALSIGRIVPSHDERLPFEKGDEKGYFLFGGSTVIVLSEPGRLIPDPDLVEASARGLEVLVRLGERIAVAATPAESQP
jgi:phosphatidylserine decarboxylase